MNNRHTRKRVWMMAGLCLLLALFAVNVGRLLVIDAPERSDLILVLAGETEIRPARALQLLEQGYGREVVIDVPADARIYDSTQLELAQRYVAQLSRATAV